MTPGAEGGTAQPRVAVVIVTYQSAQVLKGCLDSLHDQGVELTDVVVVDNASRDDTLAVARFHGDPAVKVVETGRNAGYSAAINAGVAVLNLADLDAVMVLNPDCRLRPGVLAKLAAVLARPGVGIVAPRLVHPDGSLQPSLRPGAPAVHRALAETLLGRLAGRWSLGELTSDPIRHDRSGPTSWATGAALLISSQAFRRLGPWDESFLLYAEETEYCLRAADNGLTTWYEPAAVVEHIGGEQHLNPFLTKLAVVNRVKLFRRRHNRLHSALFFAVVTAGEGMRALAGRGPSRAAFVALLRPSQRVRELPS